MADNKNGREAQAQNEERRQRERAITEELERADEPEPPVDPTELAYFETELESLEFPATAADVVATVGDHEIESADGTYTVADLLPDAEVESFESPAEVRTRVQRPTVAGAMKRVVEAADEHQSASFGASQRDGYERTFRELRAIDADDDDEGIRAIADWIIGRIHEKETLPGSRDVRRQAAKFCRSSGYSVRNDEWLGI
ncbi:hypothetical protein HISP_03450 [Haloarcula hispanica N601]|uniref:Uncharacterized protein n=2 Tax=Haloarcula hispanica TaxID=51589 RepID=V5TKT4_HALHI|nr:hypothetical protein [Haloarcula hispanica]AEM56293.1 conserved hypothetical protein [Haloarcula hispanica ATCC 33960]AHB65104.1 hypothetical protein HISP_03450 [Haloarcula hispanica N601]